MTDDEYIKTIPSLSAKELIDELNYCGRDPYYDKIREPIVAEITNRLEKIADLKANFDYVLEGKDLEIKQLGERCNQLLKDKGDLTDRFDNQTVAYETLKLHDQEEIGMLNSKVEELEQQIEKMKCGQNCKHLYINLCDLNFRTCSNCKDKWEIKEK